MTEKEPSLCKIEESISSELPEEATFDREIEYFDKYPEKITSRGLNNFRYRFQPFFREIMRKEMDVPIRDSDPDNEIAHSLMSGKKLAQTRRQFYEEIDKVVNDLGIDFKEPPEGDDQRLIPIYLELRKRGYTHYDLIS